MASLHQGTRRSVADRRFATTAQPFRRGHKPRSRNRQCRGEGTTIVSEKVIQSEEVRKVQAFERLYEADILPGTGSIIDYDCPYPKYEFLRFLVERKGILLHGSNNCDIDVLYPRQANCRSKKFGNLKAVYAVTDEILPIFYAIKDREKFNGIAKSGYSSIDSQGVPHKDYNFAVSAPMARLKPWSSGMIYILPKHFFEQGTDDDGTLIDEWASRNPVKPLAKLPVNPEDFPFLDAIQAIDNEVT